MTLVWNGDRIKRMVRQASRYGVERTVEDGVKRARKKHPGWRSRSGRLEGSIDVFRVRDTSEGVEGIWGAGAFYAVFIERGTATIRPKPFLRPAWRASNKRLRFRVKHRWRELLGRAR